MQVHHVRQRQGAEVVLKCMPIITLLIIMSCWSRGTSRWVAWWPCSTGWRPQLLHGAESLPPLVTREVRVGVVAMKCRALIRTSILALLSITSTPIRSPPLNTTRLTVPARTAASPRFLPWITCHTQHENASSAACGLAFRSPCGLALYVWLTHLRPIVVREGGGEEHIHALHGAI